MPTDALQSPNLTLLDHVLVQNWLRKIMSLASRDGRKMDLISFFKFTKIKSIDDFKLISRADVIDWRDHLTGDKKNPKYSVRTVKRRMSTISKFFEYLCDEKIVETNVITGVQRPKLTSNEGATSAISDHQAK